MKKVFGALVLAIGLVACESRADRETGRAGVDTNVTTRTAQDTTIISSDTTIRSDTIVREGEVKRDTAKTH